VTEACKDAYEEKFAKKEKEVPVKPEKIWHLDLVDRRRIDAWKLMVRGEVNKTKISR
jgi:hypothetical protein